MVLLISIHCSIALRIYPSFQYYNENAEFTSLICTDDNPHHEPGDAVEWLSPNFTLLGSTPDKRIIGINMIFNIVISRSADCNK